MDTLKGVPPKLKKKKNAEPFFLLFSLLFSESATTHSRKNGRQLIKIQKLERTRKEVKAQV